MNRFHAIQKDHTFWRILLGGWLNCNLALLYETYELLRRALVGAKEVSTFGLEARDFQILEDFGEASYPIWASDRFYLQICTQFFEAWNIAVPRKGWGDSGSKPLSSPKRIKRIWMDFCRFTVRKSNVALIGSTLPPKDAFIFWLKSGLSIASASMLDSVVQVFPTSEISYKRSSLLDGFVALNEFEKMLSRILCTHLPRAYFENFAERLKGNNTSAKLVLGGSSWLFDESFKWMAAKARDRGARIFSLQHGGYYGMLAHNAVQLLEEQVADKYVSWGWRNGLLSSSKVVPLPALKTVYKYRLQKRRIRFSEKKKIVLVTNAFPMRAHYMQSRPMGDGFLRYLSSQEKFVNHLGVQSLENFAVRLYPNDYGWALKKRWQRDLAHISIDTTRSFPDLLAEGRLLIFDHPATTFLEALACNVPTLLFWEPEVWPLLEQAEQSFETLRRVGILFNSPEEAASRLNSIISRIETWWEEPAIQMAKGQFCDVFVRSSQKWSAEWKKTLRWELQAAAVPAGGGSIC